jgi:hypothetical protein
VHAATRGKLVTELAYFLRNEGGVREDPIEGGGGGKEGKIAWRRGRSPDNCNSHDGVEEQRNKTGVDEDHELKTEVNQTPTFRVDSCSKHLLAAPLIVQNVDAWKYNRESGSSRTG